MFVLIKSNTSLNLGHLGSKSNSLGQIKEIPCGQSIGHISCSVDLKIGQNVCPYKISNEIELGLPGSKTRSLGQIKEIPCWCSRGHIPCPIDLKIGQNVCLYKNLDEFEFTSPGVINKVIWSNQRNNISCIFVLIKPWMSSNLGRLGVIK